MDHFGIGAAMRGMHEVYVQSARQTGRSTYLLDNLKDDDRVVCLTTQEARRLEELARERGLKTQFVTCPIENVAKLFEHGTPQGRTIFDHTWVEAFYLRRLENTEREIDHLQKELSGWGEAHRQTQRAARELARWKLPPLPGP